MDHPHSGMSYYPPTQLIQSRVFAHVFTQISAKAGINKHGNAAVDTMMAELAQLENMSVYEALDPNKLTEKQKREALCSINLIKEKRDCRLKGRTVADGRPQKHYTQNTRPPHQLPPRTL
jgi:hypothetical protein